MDAGGNQILLSPKTGRGHV